MRVLLIAYSYPPDPMVGSFRPAKVARALRDAGHEVHVVTARLPGESGRTRAADAGIQVHTVRALKNPRHGYLWVRGLARRLRGRSAAARPAASPSGPKRTSEVPGWKRYPISLLWVPDENQGFIPAALLRSLKLARGGIDLIYTTAPPFSDHLVGRALKALTGARWVMELRDPWSEAPSRSPEARSAPADRLNRWLESACLRAADLVISVSAPVSATLERKLGERSDRLALILNGIDHIETALPTPGDDVFRIVHTGSLYNDPRPFMRAVARVVSRLNIPAGALKVDFIGAKPHFTGPTVEQLASELGLTGTVSFTGWLPQARCRDHIREADLLLLLCEGFPTAIPNKLFDYLGARKPVLAIVDEGGESARILAQTDGHFVASSREMERIEAALEQEYRNRRARRELLNDEAFLTDWSTRRQMELLLERIQAGALAGRPGTARATRSAETAPELLS